MENHIFTTHLQTLLHTRSGTALLSDDNYYHNIRLSYLLENTTPLKINICDNNKACVLLLVSDHFISSNFILKE